MLTDLFVFELLSFFVDICKFEFIILHQENGKASLMIKRFIGKDGREINLYLLKSKGGDMATALSPPQNSISPNTVSFLLLHHCNREDAFYLEIRTHFFTLK